MIRRMLAIGSVLALTACSTYSLEELRQTTPQGSRFQNALAKYYMDFATQEEREYDWRDSWYFADKGLRAIYGKETAPEILAQWDIPEEVLPELQQASLDLAHVLTEENIERQPDASAKAQFYFDCWVEQQEENWQTDDIEFCKGEFNAALMLLDNRPVKQAKKKPVAKKPVTKNAATKGTLKKPVEIVKKAEQPHIADEPVEDKKAELEPAQAELKSQPEPEAPKKTIPTSSFVVFFDGGKAALSSAADSILSDAIKSLKGRENYEVILTNKSRKADAALTKDRSATITKRLTEGGVKKSSIKTEASGSPQITRKVEIFIND